VQAFDLCRIPIYAAFGGSTAFAAWFVASVPALVQRSEIFVRFAYGMSMRDKVFTPASAAMWENW
jgi:hypothetical protein